MLTRESAGVPGAKAAGDRFGASVASTRDHVAIGAPGDDGERGSVTVPGGSLGGPHGEEDSGRRTQLLVQGKDGLPGVRQPGDEFGAALATDGREWLAVGVPGDRVGSRGVRGGSVELVHIGAWDLGGTWIVHQDLGRIGDSAEPGDRFGASVNTAGYKLVIGVPGESSAASRVPARSTSCPAPSRGLWPAASGRRRRPASAAPLRRAGGSVRRSADRSAAGAVEGSGPVSSLLATTAPHSAPRFSTRSEGRVGNRGSE